MSVETLFLDGSNDPAMYLINYNGGGFIIISATKTYYPILAYSDNHSLSLENFDKINEGLTLWKEQTTLAIKESKAFPEETEEKIRLLWSPYETNNAAISKNTPLSYTNDDYMRWYQRMNELYTLAPGYSFGPLSSASAYISQSQYESLLSMATNMESDPAITIFGHKPIEDQEVGPLIGTSWNQGYSFNNLIENNYPAGCVAVAMAQIMKFHRVPMTYNWDNMPNEYGTFDTQTLIKNLGVATNMEYGTDGSSTTIDEAANAFSSMGYNVLKKNHNYQDVQNELLIQRRPVYMRGASSTSGHAWVCEGAKEVNSTVSYFVEYRMGDGTYSSAGGPSYQNPTTSNGTASIYFYLNWGWGLYGGNGWFLFNNVNSQNGNFDNNRKNLYVNPI